MVDPCRLLCLLLLDLEESGPRIWATHIQCPPGRLSCRPGRRILPEDEDIVRPPGLRVGVVGIVARNRICTH